MKIQSKLRIISFVIFVLCSNFGCQGNLFTPDYDIAFATPEGEPVFVEDVIYDKTWRGRGGMLFCCWNQSRAINVIERKPVPREIFIRWFNYRQQKFYEAIVHLPRNASLVFRQMPRREFSVFTLTTGFLPSGEVVVWMSDSFSEATGTWIEVARALGQVVQGDIENYQLQTEEMRERGEI